MYCRHSSQKASACKVEKNIGFFYRYLGRRVIASVEGILCDALNDYLLQLATFRTRSYMMYW